MGNDGSVITEEVFSRSTRLGILIPTLIGTVGFLILKNVKIISSKYKDNIGILYNGDLVKIFKNGN